ncbi:MAG: SufS family cysteine desulfurase [Candidatus Pacebacteria bacterium]|jgi:cysteine desulfurase / selenocysteine lyase|nr:SufS family cysteine desulfurase [Candidatus Paceibacterota bacterium]MBT4652436.1 SufS family cysteine desulfurase [Candidatus Paceibacterota bacterium]MBT6756263.1 SufS family cysteine desulfurase [Candidatus Paceibacterota bacterium]MBT6921554.1 SufS family cysteine desulfurase [Candidatus Paceibacterota bacterium]
MLDSKVILKDFPILSQKVHGSKRLVYLDSGATSQKPTQVIEAISNYYLHDTSNVHRGVHTLSDRSTQVFEDSRKTVAEFFGAESDELILTRNTTEAINGIAYGWGDNNLKKGDVVVSTEMEHHANLVVWQELCKRTGAVLKVVGLKDKSTLDLAEFEDILKQNPVKLVAFVHVSNTLGTVNPVAEIVSFVKKHTPSARIVLDAAQSAPHMPVDFHGLKVDFLAFGGHKMLAPMGAAGLLVKKSLLQDGEMKPWLFGGGMINQVHKLDASYAEDLSDLFTAGTPDVASAKGLAVACEYLSDLGMKEVMEHDFSLVKYAYEKLSKVDGLMVVGLKPEKDGQGQPNRLGSVSFIHNEVHAHDLAQILDSEGVAVRSGHHCTMPLHIACGWQATTRASFNVYNTKEDIDALVRAFDRVLKIFGK